MTLEKRIEKAEEELKPEEQGRDILITVHEEQWTHGDDDVPILVKRPIIGYTEIEWQSGTDKHGRRIGTRRALYDGGQPSSFDPEVTGD